MGVASSLGLISGINYQDLVSKLITLERGPITILQNKKADIQTKMGALDSLSVKLSSLKAAAETLDDESMFNTKSVAVTATGTDTYLTATTTSDAAVGGYTVYVDQLAQNHKFASQGWADENSTPVLNSGSYPTGGNFSFRIGDSGAITDILITTTTTLLELRDMINSADAGVSATILNDGTDTNPYRLVLTSDTTGASNDVQVTTNVTQLDFTNKVIEAATADTTNSGTYTGTVTSNTSEYYTGTTNKAYIIETITAGAVGAGPARYKYSTDGGITWDDNSGSGYSFATSETLIGGNSENVKITFTDSGTMTVGDTFRVDVFNPVFNQAQDSVIRVDTLTLIKDSNTITDVIDGVTLNLVKADTSIANTVTVSQGDVSSAKSNIESFVSAYNTVVTDLYDIFNYDPDNPTDNPLRGDYTVRGIQATLKDIVVNNMPGLTGDITALYQIGISADTTGKLTIDDDELSDALDDDPLSVMKLFIDYGTPTDSSIKYESKTSATSADKYGIYINTPPAKATYESSQVIGSGGLTEDETLTFTYTDEATEVVPTVTAFTVNLSSGDTINTIVSKFNSKFNTEEVGLLATNNGGALKIASTEYGSDIKFTVVSDKVNGAQTQTYYTGSGDGYADYFDATWATARDSATGENAYYTGNTVAVSQSQWVGQYLVSRGFFPVDTSNIPDGATINSASFKFYVDSSEPGASTTDWRLVQTTQASTSAVVTADHNQAGSTAGATADLSIGNAESGWKTFTLDSTGLGWIDKTGYTKLGIRGVTHDILDSAPTGGADLVIRSSEYSGTTYDPYLEVNYTTVQTGIGTTMLTKTGTDVVGTINGHAGYGDGKYLTGANGFPEEGLKISTTTTAAGGKGYIYLSSGTAAQLITQLDSITDSDEGTISYRNDAYQAIIDDIDDQIEIKEDRLEDLEESLRKQFVNLEVLLSSLQVQADYLATQLNSLPSLYMMT